MGLSGGEICCTLQHMEPAMVDGDGIETGDTIVTTHGGRNGQPEQVKFCILLNPVMDMEPAMVDGDGIKTGDTIVTTHGGRNGQPEQTISYRVEQELGRGLFGVVFQAKCLEKDETVAIKKVRQYLWYDTSELQTMHRLDHPNVVSLKHHFFSTTKKNELFLNLVLEYVPETLHQSIKRYKATMPMIYVKLYAYQIFRVLHYIHGSIGVYHGDIKPENLLVNQHTDQVKLCDFGHSGVLVKGEPNISCIRYRNYWNTELHDIWSAVCVLAELLLGEPLFPGESVADQLDEIDEVLDAATREEMKCVNPNDTEFHQIKAHPWPHKIFPKCMPPEAVDLISRLLQYSPITTVEALIHPFFDELRDPNVRLPNGGVFPPLFNFKAHEVKGVPVEKLGKLIPEHAREQCDNVVGALLVNNLTDEM